MTKNTLSPFDCCFDRALLHVFVRDYEETFPKSLRYKWLSQLRHHKVRVTISSGTMSGNSAVQAKKPIKPFPRSRHEQKPKSSIVDDNESNRAYGLGLT